MSADNGTTHNDCTADQEASPMTEYPATAVRPARGRDDAQVPEAAAAAFGRTDGFAVIGPDGTPVSESPAMTADRMARLTDEVAALVNQVATAVTLQDAALATVAATTPEGRARLALARTVAHRSVRALRDVVVDALGEAHVTCDQLAHDLNVSETVAATTAAAGGGVR